MLNTHMVLADAVARHRLGDPVAGILYRQILAVEPDNADALHLHGLVRLQASDVPVATAWIKRALCINATQAMYRNSLGEALRSSGQHKAALAQYWAALALNPAYPEAHANILKDPTGGVGPGGTQRMAVLERFCHLRPVNPADLCALADARMQAGHLHAAALGYRCAIAVDPQLVQAYVNLGAIGSKSKQPSDAAQAFMRALMLAPDHPGAWNNLASALWELNNGSAVRSFCQRSIALKPDHPDPYANLGYVERSQAMSPADFRAAEVLCRRALQLRPSHVSAQNNLGIVQLDLNHLDQAEALFRNVLTAEAKNADARFNLALTLLKAGKLKEAWEHYESRWATGQLPPLQLGGRPWRGEPLNGRTIILRAEQGHGDTLHFVRYAPLVAARGGRVVLVVQPALKALLATMPGVSAVYALDEPMPEADLASPMLSLPGAFGTDLGSIPANVPYLFPPADRLLSWLGRPIPGEGLRVGLVWSGDPRPSLLRANLTDRRRSLALADLAPLGRVSGVRFVSLQKGSAADQVADAPAGLELFDPMAEVKDFADTAALVLRLDLVITVDTSVAHLVGGLGKPVWVLSRFDGCWRWLLDRDDTPWYPTMRLFRQPAPGDWATVVERAAEALSYLVSGRAI